MECVRVGSHGEGWERVGVPWVMYLAVAVLVEGGERGLELSLPNKEAACEEASALSPGSWKEGHSLTAVT